MTNKISTVAGLRSEIALRRDGEDFVRAIPLTTVAATQGAETQWQTSCSFHRRAVICLLTEIISRPYDWFIGLAQHWEAVSWSARDYVVTEIDGVWLTFIGNPEERVWLLIRVSECQPDCPIDSGPYPVSVTAAKEEGLFVSCYGENSTVCGSIIDALIPALAEGTAMKRMARTQQALRANGIFLAPRQSDLLRFRLCLVGVVHQSGRIPVLPGDLVDFHVSGAIH